MYLLTPCLLFHQLLQLHRLLTDSLLVLRHPSRNQRNLRKKKQKKILMTLNQQRKKTFKGNNFLINCATHIQKQYLLELMSVYVPSDNLEYWINCHQVNPLGAALKEFYSIFITFYLYTPDIKPSASFTEHISFYPSSSFL